MAELFAKISGACVFADNPLSGEEVSLVDSNDSPVASAVTESNGLAFIEYKHKGKAAEYEVILNEFSEIATLSGKMPYAYVEFVIP